MTFYDELEEISKIDLNKEFEAITEEDVLRALKNRNHTKRDLIALLSKKAEKYLEQMAVRAQEETLKHFGKAIVLYTPLYIANYCVNRCAYCGFSTDNKIKRSKLSMEEIEKEALEISKTGLRHILLLTGESKFHTPPEYVRDAVKVLKKYFDSISIEIYPLDEDEYKMLIDEGVDGLTIYQEVYDQEIYDKVHLAGPKKDFKYRLEAIDRAAKAGIRTINTGALLGLKKYREEAFFVAMHSKYIQDIYPEVELSLSLPRIKPHVGEFKDVYPVDNKALVQMMCAFRIFLPRVGITMSTREDSNFRDNLMKIGVTKMSAGVSTKVGGHAVDEGGESQFDISDSRSVEEVREAIIKNGYQPVFKDWSRF